jgi:hypothetical protein
MPDPEGQSPEAKEWVARRERADQAVEAARRKTAREDALKDDEAERRVAENPILLLAGIVIATFVIIGGLWWFITQVECDPMISDRGMSSACK